MSCLRDTAAVQRKEGWITHGPGITSHKDLTMFSGEDGRVLCYNNVLFTEISDCGQNITEVFNSSFNLKESCEQSCQKKLTPLGLYQETYKKNIQSN